MYVTLLAVYLVLLHRYTGQRLVWVGSPVSGRHRPEFARTVGHFADLVVLSATIDPRETFAGLVARVRKTVLEALDHAAFPFRLLVQRLAPARDASRTPLVQALFALYRGQRFTGVETAPLWIGHAGAVVPFGPLRWESMALESGTSQFDVSLLVTEAPRGLAATLEFDARLFAPETAGRLLAHFVRVAELVSARWDRPLLEMQTLHDHERSRILYDWNATRAAYERDVLLHELVERQAARSPGACALLFGDDRLSYAALMERAGTLARRLQAIGVGPDSRVGVCMHRSIDLLVGLLAILRAGGAYVPVDPDYPEAYLRELIQDSGMAVLLAQEDTRERVRALGIPWIDVTSGAAHGRAMEGAARAPQRPSPLDLAYVIYTSGSTGKPKGVMNTHAGICNRLQWMQDAFRLDETDTVLQKTPLTFDVSVWELFWPLTAGARLAIAKPGGHRDADYLVGAIRAHEVTTVHFVPPMLRVLLEAPDLSGCTTLRRVICSGETLPEATQRRFGERLGAELFNLYGPTEAAVDVSWWPCRPGTGDARVPIGRPIANVRLHVLDENLEPVPPGAKGQIFIGGVALARGYLNRPDLTAERFVPDPFGDEGAGRLYATGDIGRHRADGAIEFLERSDHQVKIRGFRVELDEVASAVRRCHGVRDCVVVRVDAANGSDMLAAYVVADPTVTRTSLKQRLAALLPEFMVPASIVLLDALPLAASGKVDRQKLPPPSRAADGDLEYVAPRTALEAAVSRVWAQAFDVPQVGVDDNFFDLAGHSLLAMEIVTRLNHEFQVNLPLALLLSGAPSVALVAKALADQLGERSRELV
ncbi:MAG: non-ribosomal peptide synthetase, partial [Vicinamibacterales bacterium]